MRSNDEIITILTDLKNKKELSLSELARRVGMAKSALSRYFNKTREFPLNKVEDFARVLGSTSEYILGFEDEDITSIYSQLNEQRQTKVYNYASRQLEEQQATNVTSMESYRKNSDINEETYNAKINAKVSAGKGVYNFLECEPEIIALPAKSVPCAHFDYAFEVSGDSMEPTFKDGEIIFVKEDKYIRNGQIGVVEIDFELFVKKMYLEDDTIRLVSLNTAYDDIIADGTNEINVIGKVVM